MASIFNIQKDLYDIFNIIEENEGEMTPELEAALSIKEDELKDKIKAYTNVIKQLEADLGSIKEETARLNALKKSKERTIENLKAIMVQAINNFGDISKTGTKFLDYGTGKVSIRKSESIELDDDGLSAFSNRFLSYFHWLAYNNAFDIQEFDCKEITNYCNVGHGNDYDEDAHVTEFTEDDLSKIKANIDFKIDFKEIVSTEEGKALMRALMNYTNIVSIKPSIDKKSIKEDIKNDNNCPTFAKLITKQNVTIK